jgi:hypothetical protein
MMRRNIFLGFTIVIILIASCTSTAEEHVSSTVTKPQAQVTIIRSTLTPEIPTRIPTNTASSTKTITLTPSNTPTIPTNTITLTPTDVDWDQMPPLSDMVLSIKEISEIELDTIDPFFTMVDTTDEVENCLLDCVKTRYSFDEGSITILMLRAGNRDKAQSTVESLREVFLQGGNEVMSHDDILEIRPGSWVISERHSRYRFYLSCSASMAEDDIVVLVTFELIVAYYDDGTIIVENSYAPLEAQIEKIHEALQ